MLTPLSVPATRPGWALPDRCLTGCLWLSRDEVTGGGYGRAAPTGLTILVALPHGGADAA
jgi:hypothetical protein